jgi:hypothetical protein
LLGWEGPITHRQFAAWCAWEEMELDNPSRTDVYLMQVACEVRRAAVKNPGRVKLKDFLLKFGTDGKPKLTKEQAAAFAKAKWLGLMTMPVAERPGQGTL